MYHVVRMGQKWDRKKKIVSTAAFKTDPMVSLREFTWRPSLVRPQVSRMRSERHLRRALTWSPAELHPARLLSAPGRAGGESGFLYGTPEHCVLEVISLALKFAVKYMLMNSCSQ